MFTINSLADLRPVDLDTSGVSPFGRLSHYRILLPPTLCHRVFLSLMFKGQNACHSNPNEQFDFTVRVLLRLDVVYLVQLMSHRMQRCAGQDLY